MIEIFWKKVSNANAFLFSLLGMVFLLAAIIWFLRPGSGSAIRMDADLDADEVESYGQVPVGPRPALTDELAALNPDKNPFTSDYLDRVNAQLAWARSVGRDGGEDFGGVADDPAEDKQAGDPTAGTGAEDPERAEGGGAMAVPAPKPPRSMRLVYRGMLMNLDGTRLALVENVDAGFGQYYPPESAIDWVDIVQFSRDALMISSAGTTNILRRGVEFKVEEREEQ